MPNWTLITVTVIVLGVPSETKGQYGGYFYDSYMRFQPSARSEGMGGTSTALVGVDGFFYNPAKMGHVAGIHMLGSISAIHNPNVRTDETCQSLGLAYAATSKLNISYFYRRSGISGDMERVHSLSSSYQVWKDIFLGLSVDVVQSTNGDRYAEGLDKVSFPINLGILKAFKLPGIPKYNHTLYVGVSWSNVNKVHHQDEDLVELPQLSRYAVAYSAALDLGLIRSHEQTFKLILTTEFEDVRNSKYYEAFKYGAELEILQVFAMRMGYRTRDILSGGVYRSRLEANSYGFGIRIPLRKILRRPIFLQVDYARSKDPSFRTDVAAGYLKVVSVELSYELNQ